MMNNITIAIILILNCSSVMSQTSPIVGKFHLDNDTIIINSDHTFRLSIHGHDSSFHVRREVYTGKGQIENNTFNLIHFDQAKEKLIFWKCDKLTFKKNVLYAPACNTTSSKNKYKRIKP